MHMTKIASQPKGPKPKKLVVELKKQVMFNVKGLTKFAYPISDVLKSRIWCARNIDIDP